MTVTITIQGENADEALQELAGLAKGMMKSAAAVAHQPPADNEHVAEGALPFQTGKPVDGTPQRERGKPSAGRARRTKEEIAEDEAADAAEAAGTATTSAQEATEATQSDPAEEAQDAKDEAADPVSAPKDTATRDDVRAAMVAYSQAHGLPKLNADMSALLGKLWEDGSVTKLSEIPEDAAAFASVIEGLKGMA